MTFEFNWIIIIDIMTREGGVEMDKLTINQWMGLRELTGEKLAEITGLSVSTVSNIRTGKVEPSLSSLQKIAEALSVKLDDIKV